MDRLARFGVSMEEGLLRQFDQIVAERQWANRSEAVRDMVRQLLVDRKWTSQQGEVCATLTFVYDHHINDLQSRLTHLQHEHEGVVLAATHVHLDHHNCLEVLVLKGPAAQIERLADRILGTRGVKHGQLVRSVPVGQL